MSGREAARIFPIAHSWQPQKQAPADEQSYCVYPGSTYSSYVVTNVTWSKAVLSNFEKAHDGKHVVEAGTLPSGESVPAPTSAHLTVDGTSAYWTAHQSFPVSGTSNYPSLIAASKGGYVVSVSSRGLSESQNEHVLVALLSKL